MYGCSRLSKKPQQDQLTRHPFFSGLANTRELAKELISRTQSEHVENDESWHPLLQRIIEIHFVFPPLYMWGQIPRNKGSHFQPDSDYFYPMKRKMLSLQQCVGQPWLTCLWVYLPQWVLSKYLNYI